MKLTVVIHVNLMNGRGSEKVLLNILKYRPSDFSVTVLQTDFIERQRITKEEIQKILDGAQTIEIHRNIIGRNSQNIFNIILNNIILRSYKKDKKAIRIGGILKQLGDTDIVYLFSNFYAILFDRSKMPVIGSNHAIDPSLFYDKNPLKRLYYRLYWRIYFQNINGYHVFPKNAGLLPRMLNSFGTRFNMVLSNGVDTDTYYPENRIVNDKLKVFFVASLTKRKGLDILLPLIDRFENNSDIEFYVAGGGPLEGEVKKRKNITYLGVLDEKELASEYRKCDLFVYPSHDDFYGLVVLEALSSGLYVLCGEFLKGNFDDFEGRYLEYIKMNVHSFYLRIVDIMNDRSIIMHSKEDEYDYVKSNYDWKVVSSTFYQEMRRLYKQFQKEVLHTQ